MLTSYAKTVKLMPGHEFLKPEYNIEKAKAGGRNVAIELSAKELIDLNLAKAQAKKLPPKKERMLQIINSFTFSNLEIKPGNFAIKPSDPVATPDGKLHFEILKGDKLIKLAPPKGNDFILFQMRQDQPTGKWKIVAEYID